VRATVSRSRSIAAELSPAVNQLDESLEQGTKFAFQCFLWFGVIVFIAPQAFVPGLSALGIGKIVMFLALFSYARFAFSQHRVSIVTGSELKTLGWLLLLALLSAGFSRWPGGSVQFFMDFAWKAGVVFFLAANLLVSVGRAQQLCWTFVLFAAVNAFIGIQNWRSGNMMSGATNRIEGGFAPLATNPNDLGLLLDMCLPLTWYAYRVAKTTRARNTALLITIASALTVVITFSRGAFLGLAVVAGLLVWKISSGKRIQTVLAIAVILPVIMAILPAGYSDRMLSIFQSDMDETGSREHRIKLMEAGVVSMIEHPLGVGLGMNILASADAGTGWNVIHNAYLQVGVELGILGLVLYLMLLWTTYKGLQEIERQDVFEISNLAFAIRLSLIAYAVGAFFGPVAFNFYFFYPGGMAVALKSLVKRAPHLLQQAKVESI